MKIKLYDYQLQAIEDLLMEFKVHKHLLLMAACGWGKSYAIAEIARRSVDKNKKVLILSHRLILLRQNNGALADFGHEMITINDHGYNMPLNHNLYCSTLQTLQSRLKRDGFMEFISTFDLVLIDEAHTQHSNFLWVTGVLDDIYVIGFTGSPRRSGLQRFLGQDYDKIVYSLSVQELIDLKKLVPCKYYEVPLDVSGIKIDPMTGDFQAKSSFQKFDSPSIYGGVIHNYLKYGENRQFVCFCTSILHAIKTCLEFQKAGIKTKFVVSNLSRPVKPEEEGGAMERYFDNLESYEALEANKHLLLAQSEVNNAFISGEIQGVISLEILTIGWDYKPLSCLIINRATQSIPLFIQMGGRIQRPYEGKELSIVIDMGDNIRRLGTFEQERTWQLFHESNDSVGIAPEKLCEGIDNKGRKGCGRLILASMAVCICGFRFTTPEELRVVELQERLSEAPDQYKEMTALQLKDFAELKSYAKSWVWRQLSLRGETEFRQGMRELGYNSKFIYRMQKMYF
jgi:superfamily II DNA or RNA helicase